MTLTQLRYIIAIADTGSMNEAAKQLFISQPSLSETMKELETEIGLDIFLRSNRGIVITPEGEEFLGYARQVTEQFGLLQSKYIDKKVKEKFSVSTQHYTFAVKAFVETVKQIGMEQYEFAVHETTTISVIENVKNFKSEIGVLYENDAYRLAPVFDNGASFANKCTEKRLELMLSDETRIQSSIQNTATTYGLKGKPLLARDLETLKYPGLLLAEKRMIPVIQLKMQEIYDFIENIPEAYNGYLVCSKARKQFYMKSMSKRLETFLLPALENAKQEILKKRRQNHLGL